MNKFIVKKTAKKDYEQFTVRIEVELLDQVRNIVAENNLKSVNEFINDCIRFAINNMEIEEEK